MLAEHAAAVLDLLRGNANLTVHDGTPPDNSTPPYVVAWINLDAEESGRVCGESNVVRVRVTTHSLATTGQGARIVGDGVRAALLDVEPVIAGRVVWPIRHEFSIPPERNEQTGYAWIDQVDTWTFRTEPGS